jgi:hypothetical protein
MTTSSRPTSREKVRAYRARMRRRGMRLIQMWVPDTGARAFRRQAHLDSLAVAGSRHEDEDQAFVDAISAWDAGE